MNKIQHGTSVSTETWNDLSNNNAQSVTHQNVNTIVLLPTQDSAVLLQFCDHHIFLKDCIYINTDYYSSTAIS